jgi:hypothetical protein
MCSALGHVRFTPESDIKCDIWGCPLRGFILMPPPWRGNFVRFLLIEKHTNVHFTVSAVVTANPTA